MQCHKNIKQRIIVWISDNSDKNDNINEIVPTSIAPHLPNAVQLSWYIFPNTVTTPRERDAEKVSGSLGYLSRMNIHSFSRRRND